MPAGQPSLKGGAWKRSKYTGTELFEKTLGVVGLGRIGVLVAQRLAAFGMNVVAYDPYVTQRPRRRSSACGSSASTSCSPTADFITVHLPKTPETVGLIGEEALRKVKPTVRIVNAARGGIVDEAALYAALKEGRVAGAGLDVFAKEPCTDSPLFELDNVVVTPHLGASTDEAQERAGISVARSVRLALAGELVPDAVNVSGGVIAEDVRPGIPLVEKLGRVFTALAGGLPTAARRRGARRDHRARRHRAAARRAQGPVHGRRRRAGLLRQRARARAGARHRGPAAHRPGERRVPQRDRAARHPRRRHPGRRSPAR